MKDLNHFLNENSEPTLENIKSYIESGKIYVSNMKKLYLTAAAITDLIKLFFIKPYNLSSAEDELFKFINLNERI